MARASLPQSTLVPRSGQNQRQEDLVNDLRDNVVWDNGSRPQKLIAQQVQRQRGNTARDALQPHFAPTVRSEQDGGHRLVSDLAGQEVGSGFWLLRQLIEEPEYRLGPDLGNARRCATQQRDYVTSQAPRVWHLAGDHRPALTERSEDQLAAVLPAPVKNRFAGARAATPSMVSAA